MHKKMVLNSASTRSRNKEVSENILYLPVVLFSILKVLSVCKKFLNFETYDPFSVLWFNFF